MVRFFAVVRQSPSYAFAVLAAVTAFGVLTVALNPAELDSALGLVLFVQMFLASTGFAVTARRGHFDPVLVQGSDRSVVLFVQWCASIAPGVVAWAIVAGCGYAWASPAAWSALTGTRLAALAIVSAVAWVAGFMLPRGAGGALWMGLLVTLLLRHTDLLAPAASHDSPIAILRAAGALVVCPFLLLGTHVPIGGPPVAAAVAVAAVLVLATIRQARWLDVFLVERS